MKWTRIDRPFPLPVYVREALLKLDDAGHVAYVVGGSVRDFMLGRESKDHDIATSASPDELCELFPRAVTVGKAFGVIKIPVPGAPDLEIATFREDLEYKDHRHPKGIRFAGPAEDAERRDFTVNALFFDPKTSRALDTVGGLVDLQGKLIRAIGDPQERFREDALRLLRAARFATTLDFALDPPTAAAVKDRAKLIARVSAERIRDELALMWTGPRPAKALDLLSQLGLLSYVLPEVERLHGVADTWDRTLRLLELLVAQNPSRSPTLAWAAVLLGVGRPIAWKKSGNRGFAGHELEGGKIAFTVGTRLKMPREDIDRIVALVEDQLKFREVFQMREATLQRFIREPHFPELLALHRADATITDGNLASYEFCASRYEEGKKQPEVIRLIDGTDLIQLGLSPGPGFSQILRDVEDLAFEKKLVTKEQALEYVVKHFVK